MPGVLLRAQRLGQVRARSLGLTPTSFAGRFRAASNVMFRFRLHAKELLMANALSAPAFILILALVAPPLTGEPFPDAAVRVDDIFGAWSSPQSPGMRGRGCAQGSHGFLARLRHGGSGARHCEHTGHDLRGWVRLEAIHGRRHRPSSHSTASFRSTTTSGNTCPRSPTTARSSPFGT